ncbi:hypothetical protein BDW22DRAFT_1303235, partial [Trametopsis cervina]
RDDRPVTPPPPQPPSLDYLEIANELPQPLSPGTTQRKLLILDLNGTLVHRSAPGGRRNRNEPPPPADKHGRPQPRLRAVHPRPYMPAFRSYLFAPETKSWLDVMIWSSAQPHSVADMASRCFGTQTEDLLAVWARDTLGLSEEHYHRKVQTVKDLNIPWSKLDAHTHAHSALTTLLLDDSPRKAERQPYNHFCVPEYSGEMRVKDLEALRIERMIAETETQRTTDSGEPSSSPSPPQGEAEPHRKKKTKEEKKLQAAMLDPHHSSRKFDETLVAVVGVLDEARKQQNIAAWIRAGGLWGSETLTAPTTSQSQSGSSVPGMGMWFEHPPTLSFWARKGREALARLGIPVEHGIER